VQRVLGLGADVSMQSVTKFLGGHSDALGGALSASHEVLERVEAFRRRSGGVMSPDVAWLVARSLPTLALRVRAQASAALTLAHALSEHGAPVRRVHHPGLPDHPDHVLATGQMDGFGSMLAVEIGPDLEAAVAFYDRLRVVRRAVSLGGVESVASIPADTSHAMLTSEQRRAAGVPDGLVRFSIGLEPVDELLDDLRQALTG